VVIRQVGEAKKGGGSAQEKTLRFGRQTDCTQSSTWGKAQPGILLAKFKNDLSRVLPHCLG
jgi:hypothetical protein